MVSTTVCYEKSKLANLPQCVSLGKLGEILPLAYTEKAQGSLNFRSFLKLQKLLETAEPPRKLTA